MNKKTKTPKITSNNLIKRMYKNMKSRQEKRGHGELPFTFNEYRKWIKYQTKFPELFKEYKESGYLKSKVPSTDRLDDYRGYSFVNMRITTWEENNKKANEDRKNCINNKVNLAVYAVRRGEPLEKAIYFDSMSSAARSGFEITAISKCIKGVYKSHKNYYFYSAELYSKLLFEQKQKNLNTK